MTDRGVRRSAARRTIVRCAGAPVRVATLALLAVVACSPLASTSPTPVGSAPATPTSPGATSSSGPGQGAGWAWAALPDNPELDAAFVGNLAAGGAGRLLAAGYVGQGEGVVEGAIWASEDGRSWVRLTDRPGFEDAAVGRISRGSDGTFLAVGSTCYYECAGVRMWRSVDGATWTAVTHDLPGSSFVTVIPGDPGWIAVGEIGLPLGSLAAWTSTDGMTWVRATGMGTDAGDVRGLVATTNGYLAAGSVYPEDRSEPAVWTSPDGAAWSRVPPDEGPEGLGIDALTQLDGVLTAFVRTGSGIELWTSGSGLEWTHLSNGSAPLEIQGSRSLRMSIVVEGGPGVVVFGVADPGDNSAPIGAWLSGDGLTWQAADDVSAFADNAEVYDGVRFGDEVLVAGRVPCRLDGCVERPAFWISPPR